MCTHVASYLRDNVAIYCICGVYDGTICCGNWSFNGIIIIYEAITCPIDYFCLNWFHNSCNIQSWPRDRFTHILIKKNSTLILRIILTVALNMILAHVPVCDICTSILITTTPFGIWNTYAAILRKYLIVIVFITLILNKINTSHHSQLQRLIIHHRDPLTCMV